MTEQRINEYIEGKYGKFGVHRYALSTTLFLLFQKLIFIEDQKTKSHINDTVFQTIDEERVLVLIF